MQVSKLLPFLAMVAVLSIASAASVFFSTEDGVQCIYENITQQEPYYVTSYEAVETCGMHKLCINQTIGKDAYLNCTDVFSCYDRIVPQTVLGGYHTVVLDIHKIGERVGETNYYGIVHSAEGNLSRWTIPIGDRNMQEYSGCRAYEKQKGVCVSAPI